MKTKISILVMTVLAIVLLQACSDQAALNKANNKIAQLEKELAIERSKSSSQTESPQPSAKPVRSVPVKPEPTNQGTQWGYAKAEDKMTGGTTYHAIVLSTNTVDFDFPYQGSQNARLHLRIDPKYGKDVIFSLEKGQILCNSYEDCTVLVRFDDEKPMKFSAAEPADHSSETVFIENYSKFVGEMMKAKTVRISANIYQQGSPVFEFDVSGFDVQKYKPKK